MLGIQFACYTLLVAMSGKLVLKVCIKFEYITEAVY